jgi:hypothetical protein
MGLRAWVSIGLLVAQLVAQLAAHLAALQVVPLDAQQAVAQAADRP